MARIRTVKPQFFTNEKLGDLPPLARLLYIGLWTIADREGRLEDRPRRIKAQVLPWDDCDAEELLAGLCSSGFITRYEVGGEAYISITGFREHQRPHPKEAPSAIPAPSLGAVKRNGKVGASREKDGTSRVDYGLWTMGNGGTSSSSGMTEEPGRATARQEEEATPRREEATKRTGLSPNVVATGDPEAKGGPGEGDPSLGSVFAHREMQADRAARGLSQGLPTQGWASWCAKEARRLGVGYVGHLVRLAHLEYLTDPAFSAKGWPELVFRSEGVSGWRLDNALARYRRDEDEAREQEARDEETRRQRAELEALAQAEEVAPATPQGPAEMDPLERWRRQVAEQERLRSG